MRMMKCIKFIIISLMTFGSNLCLHAQNILTKTQAVSLALENNFDIKLAENNSSLAQINTSKFNTGILPTVGFSGAYNYNLDNVTANFQDGRNSELSFAESQSVNSSINVNYTLFDGFFRKYNIQQLQERYALSKIELEAAMENIAAQTLIQYYQVANLNENLSIINRSIQISEDRRNRAIQEFEFGKGSQLVILNAQVDLNNDSLNYYNTELQLKNAKRLLNNLMVRSGDVTYEVELETDFLKNLDKSILKEDMLNDNLMIGQFDKNIKIGNISLDMAKARKLPTIGTNASYGYNYSKNNSASFLSSLNNNGLAVGLTMSWNIFDGGTTRHSMEQIKLNNINLAIQKEQMVENLIFDFENAWALYENRLFIYQTQLKNLEINKSNFMRSEEEFKIGQINSVDFRQAQMNLQTAETVLNAAKFDVKISEIELLLLSGHVLD